MTNNEKEMIRELRMQGLGYGKVAERTGIKLETVKSFCRRHGLREKEKLWRASLTKNTNICFVRTAVRKSSRSQSGKENCSAVMPAGTTGGRSICTWWIGKPTTISPVRTAVKNSGRMGTVNGSIAATNATSSIGLGSKI